jgi:ribosomal protein S18 acetylase RimI-like enzyme
MENLKIRKMSVLNVAVLREIGVQTFVETFASYNTPENMQNYIDSSFSIEHLKKELNEPNSEFYVAMINDEVCGYLKINFAAAQTEINDKNSLEIERIYVLTQFQGKQIGQALFQKAKEVAHKANANYIWLGVWEKNTNALNFYKKNGFVEFDKHIFKLGDDLQTDILMRLNLKAE